MAIPYTVMDPQEADRYADFIDTYGANKPASDDDPLAGINEDAALWEYRQYEQETNAAA